MQITRTHMQVKATNNTLISTFIDVRIFFIKPKNGTTIEYTVETVDITKQQTSSRKVILKRQPVNRLF